ncbi:hypothetical protein KR018_007253 [Drosophila ironensis]|nr:hypothetical protein KR018_007253 [Drosophila ironensis]
MVRGVLPVLLLVACSQIEAATHVNISIAQQPATNPADVNYVDGRAPAELRAGPNRDEDQSFQRIQERPQLQLQQQQQQQQVVQSQQQQQQVVPQQQQLTPRQGLGLQPPVQGQGQGPVPKNGRLPRRRGHARRPSVLQQPPTPHSGQFRQRNQQLRQNQEFERYIQSYHSHGPTVETVYESSNPAPQRYTQSSSGVTSSLDESAPQKVVSIGGARSQQLRMFERQVAAPVSAQSQSGNVEAPQDSKPIYEPPPSPVQTASLAPPVSSGPVSSVSVSASSSSSSASSSSAAAPSSALPQPAEPSSGYDAPASYNPSTSYNRPSYDPSGYNYEDAQEVDYQDQYAPEVGDDLGYEDYADQTGYQGGSGYLPPAPPSRTYTPPPRPLVTKTIQIVQPALKAKKYEVRHPAIQKEFYDIEERVVIKPAGTLVVELEHPVAKIPKGETLLPLGHPHPAVAAAYGNNNNGQIDTQSYNNGPEYRPSYEIPPSVKDQQATTIGSSVTTMPSYDQAPKDEYVESRLQQPQPVGDVTDGRSGSSSTVSAVDANGNAIKINAKHLTPNMIQRAEPEQDFARGQRVYKPAPRNNYNRQPQYNDDDDYFSGEYLPNVKAGSVDAKPARLELAEKEPLEQQRTTQIIKHEHKIHLPPSQHNIYLGRSRQTPLKERRIQEVPAQVTEIKPYLRNHAGPTVVYAKSPAPRAYYSQSARQRSPLAEDLEYSAPYSQMRFSPENQSSRLVEAPKEEVKQEKQEKEPQNTHIQIQIASESQKPLVVASTIAPDCDKGQQRSEMSQRLVEAPKAEVAATQATPTQSQAQPDVDVALNGAAGHLKPNERVIAATAAPTDASATSETFHKRRIVVNHPFQTVREVVEHEPITNYHQIQVNEPAPPSLYHQAYYQPAPQTHGSLVHYQTTSTHGNLYAPYG